MASAGAALFTAPVRDLLDRFGEETPVPGAGSAAALSAAVAAALLGMVARVSRPDWGDAGGTVAQANLLRTRLERLVDADAEAYASALAALTGTDGGGSFDRDTYLAAALDRAADVPLEIAAVAADVSALAEEVAGRGEPRLRADAVGAAIMAGAAARAAAHLVVVNLTVTEGDERVRRAEGYVASAQDCVRRMLASDD